VGPRAASGTIASEEARKYGHGMTARRKKLKVKVDCWANVHEDGSILVWPTRELAEEHPTHGTIACIHIKRQVTEGDGGVVPYIDEEDREDW